MALDRKLKAFVRFDGSGRVIPGSLVLRKNKPKIGDWRQSQAWECNSGTSYSIAVPVSTADGKVIYRSPADSNSRTLTFTTGATKGTTVTICSATVPTATSTTGTIVITAGSACSCSGLSPVINIVVPV
jgi:hypothetical protein